MASREAISVLLEISNKYPQGLSRASLDGVLLYSDFQRYDEAGKSLGLWK